MMEACDDAGREEVDRVDTGNRDQDMIGEEIED
jgi:hypothetical protein